MILLSNLLSAGYAFLIRPIKKINILSINYDNIIRIIDKKDNYEKGIKHIDYLHCF